jgi:hypothetical protein
MAAPETRPLKAARLTIIASCMAMIVAVSNIGVLRALIGNAAGVVTGLLLMLLAVLVPVYVTSKLAADDAHLDHLIATGELGSAEGEGERA